MADDNGQDPTIGDTTVAYAAGGTTITVSPATALTLESLVGSAGTFDIIGRAVPGGSTTTKTVTYSAVNTGTGVITITPLNRDFIVASSILSDRTASGKWFEQIIKVSRP